jgi:arabinogalactan oligomer/maltooligosaccharide transport system permease protein
MTVPTARAAKRNPLRGIAGFFKGIVVDFVEGDAFVKLSALIMGAGFFRRKQIIKGVIMTVFQAVIIYFSATFGAYYLSRFGTLGTVKREILGFNEVTGQNMVNDFDHSFQILLFGVISIIVLLIAFVVYLRNIRTVRALEVLALEGKHIPSFIESVKAARDKRFHVTLLTLPCIGIIVFTIIPLIVMITVAFTNYDRTNMPPNELFTWVGFDNFRTLFTNNITSSFGYAFGIVLTWTLIWAFSATFSNFFLGIMLASYINNTRTKLKRMWRTMFIVSIAVPQFVTLLVVRNFFSTNGIANTLASEWGITEFLMKMNLIPGHLDYIPFLTDPGWARVMIILINIWIGVPFMMLIATGILMNIPKDLYESARIDGANPFKQFIYITMPYMLFITAPFLVTSVIQNINNFNVIYLLTQDVYRTTDQMLANAKAREIDLLVTWLYRLTQEEQDFKMASVIGIMVFVVCSVFALIAFNMVLGRNKEDKFQL